MKRFLAISAMMLLALGIAAGAKKPKAPKPVACKTIAEFMAAKDSSLVALKGVSVAAVATRGFVVWDGKGALLVSSPELLNPGDKVTVTGLKLKEDGKPFLRGIEVKAKGKGSLAGLEYGETLPEESQYAIPVVVSGMLESRTVIDGRSTYEEYFIYVPDAMEKKPRTRIKLWYPNWEILGGSLTNHVTAKGFIVGALDGDIPQNLLLMSSFEETQAPWQTLTSMPFLAPGSKFMVSGTVTDVSKRVMTLSDFTGSIQLPVPEDVKVSRGVRVSVRAKLGDGTLIEPKYRTSKGLSFSGKPKISLQKASGEQFEGVMTPVPGGYFFGKATLEGGDEIRINGMGFKGGKLLPSASQPLHKCSIKVSADIAGTYDIWYFPECENAIVVRSGKRSKANEFTPLPSEQVN